MSEGLQLFVRAWSWNHHQGNRELRFHFCPCWKANWGYRSSFRICRKHYNSQHTENEPVTITAEHEDSERVSHDTTNTDQSLQNSTQSEAEQGVFDKVQNRPSVIEVHSSTTWRQEEIRERVEVDSSETKENEGMDADVTTEHTTLLQVPIDQSQTTNTLPPPPQTRPPSTPQHILGKSLWLRYDQFRDRHL